MRRTVLAIDIGASSGRAILGHYDGTSVTLEEVHRFANDAVQVGDTLYWDVFRLWFEIQQGILRAKAKGPIDSIGIDTWGVDFGLIDGAGNLIEHPVHYRDPRTEGVPEEVYHEVSAEELFRRTGLHALRINSLFQLRALRKKRSDSLERAHTLLFMPDLLAFLLTGKPTVEHTIASTSQLLRADQPDWDFELIRKLGLPGRIFPRVILPGQAYGTVQPAVASMLGIGEIPVIAVGAHDTASAVLAAGGGEVGSLFLSSGTWSLMGSPCSAPCLSDAARAFNLANEAGIGSTLLLRNIMGLWLVQESRRWWQRDGSQFTFPELEREAMDGTTPFASLISPNDPAFEAPGDMPGRVAAACKATGQAVPTTRGQVVRAVYESLAMQYRLTASQLASVTGNRFDLLNLVGGGAQSRLLCQMTADAMRMPVQAGPIEATALGNMLMQLSGLGELPDPAARKKVLAASAGAERFEPRAAESTAFDAAYPKFLELTGQAKPE